MPSRRRLGHQPPGDGGAGEGDVIDARMGGERGAGVVPIAGDDVERTGGEANLRGELGEAEDRQAGILGRLHHARVAGRERGADGAPEDLHRVVPRDDVPGDAVRLAQGEHRVARLVRQRLAVQLVAGAAVVLEVAGQGGGVDPRGLERLAGVTRLELRELLVALGDGDRKTRHQTAALGCGQASPRTVERLTDGRARGGHRPRDVGGSAPGQRADDLARARVHDRDGVAAAARLPAVVDEVMLLHASRSHQHNGRR